MRRELGVKNCFIIDGDLPLCYGTFKQTHVMKKKPAASTQVRIGEELSNRIARLQDACEFRISRAAFVETLIWRGITATEATIPTNKWPITKPSGDSAESTLKK